jgi:hypothetical protein
MVKIHELAFSGFYLEFNCVEFEFELNSNSNSNLNLLTNLLPKSFSKALTACWAGSFLRRPVGPSSFIGPADRVAPRPNPPEFPLSFVFSR